MTIIIIIGSQFVKKHIMRISKAQAEKNRARVVESASALFRKRGFEGVAVSDLMKAAGFTHGGFYNHFPAKESLLEAALASAWKQMAAERARTKDLEQLLSCYLSLATRQAPGKSCPAAALAGDVSRQPRAVKAVFAGGLEEMIQSVQARLTRGSKPARREFAVSLVTRMVGALLLSRAVPDESPLAHELLDATLCNALREVKS